MDEDGEGDHPLHPQSNVPEYTVDRKQWDGPHGTLESIIKAQRRIKGVILSVEEGRARIASEYGEFPFNLSSVKVNKKYPDRQPQAHDRCEFKVSDANPPKATSIRIAVPKAVVLATNGNGVADASANGASSQYSVGGSSNTSGFGASDSSGLNDLLQGFATNQWAQGSSSNAENGSNPGNSPGNSLGATPNDSAAAPAVMAPGGPIYAPNGNSPTGPRGASPTPQVYSS